jgi:hypothetical protein
MRILLGAAALTVCLTAIAAGPSRKQLAALLENPASDWSTIFPDVGRDVAEPKNGVFTEEQGAALDKQSGEFDILRELADIDAIGYAKTHAKPEELSEAGAIGKATAFRHNLIGGAANAYSGFFADALNALYK